MRDATRMGGKILMGDVMRMHLYHLFRYDNPAR